MAKKMKKGPENKVKTVKPPKPRKLKQASAKAKPEPERTVGELEFTCVVHSEDEMESMREFVEKKGYKCTTPEPIFPGGSRRDVTLVGQILLGEEERARVEVKFRYDQRETTDYRREGGFEIFTNDPVIKQALEEVRGNLE
jgi:hypothetical protein